MHDHPALYALTAILAVGFFINLATATLTHAAPTSTWMAPAADNAGKPFADLEERLDRKAACNRKYTGCITAAMFVTQGQGLSVQEGMCMDGYRSCVKGNIGPDGKADYDRYR